MTLNFLKEIFDKLHIYVYQAILFNDEARPNRGIEDLAILYSYMINPNLEITKRRKHYELM